MKKYEATLLSYGDNDKFPDPSKKDFNTREDAWNYVIEHLCDSCRSSKNPIKSQCAAEWMVEEYESEHYSIS